jgi:regulator of replication initiation timing
MTELYDVIDAMQDDINRLTKIAEQQHAEIERLTDENARQRAEIAALRNASEFAQMKTIHFEAEIAALKTEIEILINVLLDCIYQSCYAHDDKIDSMALSSYAEAIRLLAEYGKLKITTDYGRRVIADVVEAEETNG